MRNYAQERLNAPFVGMAANPLMCQTCSNAQGEPPWEDGPRKTYCKAFRRSEGIRKPSSVYYGGGPCIEYDPIIEG